MSADAKQPGLDSPRLAAYQRRNYLTSGIVLLGLLVLAGILKPNAAGYGTHQQLGLPPCTFKTIFGVRCPTCGMTTSWSYFVRGNLAASWQANAGGTCLAISAAIGAVWAILSAIRGENRLRVPRTAPWAFVALVLAITLLDWAIKLT